MDYFLRRDLRYRTSAAAPPPSARSVSVAGSGDPTIGRGNTAVVGVCAATDAVSSSDARIVAGPSHRVMLLFHSLMVESSSASGCLRIRRLLLGVAQGSNLPARSAAAVYGHFNISGDIKPLSCRLFVPRERAQWLSILLGRTPIGEARPPLTVFNHEQIESEHRCRSGSSADLESAWQMTLRHHAKLHGWV